ncbi:MAG: zinc-binding dehydrogenase [Leptospiraceae bacterium]|nr:zinc-binding dehydrogenase [Leptospiraceae bacterium]
MTRQIWQMPRAGNLARLTLQTANMGDLPAGSVRVAVKAIGLNFADIFACLGLYSATPTGSFIPGLEFAGEVVAVSGDVHFRPGQLAMGVTRFGAYASMLDIDQRYLWPLPSGWSLAEGAAWPVQALTAWYALHELGAVKPGQRVLVHSAAGGVGLHALAMLRDQSCLVTATIGNAAKKSILLAQGLAADQIIVREKRRFGVQLDRALAALCPSTSAFSGSQSEQSNARLPAMPDNDGYDLILDGIAGPFFEPAFNRLRPAGRYILFGAANFMNTGSRVDWLKTAWRYLQRPRLDPVAMISDNRSLMAFNLIWLWSAVDQMHSLLGAMDESGYRNRYRPLVAHSFDFQEAPAALRFFQSGQSVGKVVLQLSV